MPNLISLLESYQQKASLRTPVRRMTERLQDRLIDLLEKDPPRFLNDCEFRPIQSGREFEQVAQLMHLEMERSKKTERQLRSQWFSLAQATEANVTLVCLYKKQYLLGAVSIAKDSKLGLPLDKTYRNYTHRFRSMGRTIAEITALVQNSAIITGSANFHFSHRDRTALCLTLIKEAIGYVKRTTGVDTVMLRFDRRHEAVYKALSFRPLTGLKYYTGYDTEEFPAFFLDLAYLKNNPQKLESRLTGVSASKIPSAVHRPFSFSMYEVMHAFSLIKAA